MPSERLRSVGGGSVALLLTLFVLPACSDGGGSPAASGGHATTAGMSGGGSAGAGGAGVQAGGDSGGSAGSGGSGGSSGGDAGPCAPATALVCDNMAPFPAMISETGLFPALPDLSMHHARAHVFEPNPPLWSDGLAKERLVVVPDGLSIDNTDSAKWEFPMGTLFVKSFFDDGGPNHARRPIETRFIRHSPDPADPFQMWEFAVYQWNEAGTDAALVSFADASQSTPVQVVVDRMENGKPLKLNDGQPFSHDIPSKQQCQACHDSNAKVTEADIIGFDELRLNWKPAGAAKTQLETLAELKLLSSMPAAPRSIVEADPVLARVKAFVQGNCVHCHNGAEGMLDLQPDVFVANTVNMDSQGAGIMPPSAEWKRVVPKQPELSILFAQVRRAPLPTGQGIQMRPMPPLGVAVADMTRPSAATDPPDYAGQLPPMTTASVVPEDPLADIAAWINGLE